jgi:hypothetical protein
MDLHVANTNGSTPMKLRTSSVPVLWLPSQPCLADAKCQRFQPKYLLFDHPETLASMLHLLG